MKITRVGLDLAKNVFQVHAVDEHDKPVRRCQLRRSQVVEYFAKLPPCLVGMEACAGSHYWARRLSEFGHTVKLMAPQHVKGYVQGNKNDANDASAICEAVSRPRMRFVPVKSVEQQDIQAVHRVRSELIRQRTAKINQIRGLLGEYGIAIPQGAGAVRRQLPDLIEDAKVPLSMRLRELLEGLRQDLVYLDARVLELDRRIDQIAKNSPIARNLMKQNGIGPKGATALLASIGDGHQFTNGRQVSANHGMVPAQHSSGGKHNLLGMSKRGDAYLRTVLIHGARAVVKAAANKDDPLSRWIQGICARRNKNIAAVALANKNLRIAWSMIRYGTEYDPNYHSKQQARHQQQAAQQSQMVPA